MAEAGACPSCHGTAWHEVTGGDPGWHLFRCGGCGCFRIYRPETPSEGLYDEYYSEGSAQRLAGPFHAIWKAKRRARARLLLRHAPAGARVCDIGCERGELLNVLKEGGCRVVGTQLSAAAATFAQRQFGVEVFVGELPQAPFSAETFDVVLMLNVLEHLPDPEAYVRHVAAMLGPGGAFWIEIPNAGSFTARLTGKNWLHHDPLHHLWAFDRAGLRRLIARHGFAIERVYPYSWEHGPIGALQSWLNALPGRKNVIFDIVRRGLSRDAASLAREAVHVALAALLLPFAFVVAAAEGMAGEGQVVLVRARKI